MAQTFSCPSCNGSLDYDGRSKVVRCPYCNSSVIVPESLRASAAPAAPGKPRSRPTPNPKPTPTPTRTKGKEQTWIVIPLLLLSLCPIILVLFSSGGPFYPLWLRLYPFTPARLVMSLGQEGEGESEFYDLRSVAADAAGNIYAADYGNGRIQVFASDGCLLSTWPFANDLYLFSLDITNEGTVYVVTNQGTERYASPDGTLLGPLNSGLFSSDDLAVLPGGGLLVLNGDLLLRLDAQENVVWQVSADTLPDNASFERVAADAAGNSYVLGRTSNARSSNDVVFKFTAEGESSGQFGQSGEDKGQLDSPMDIAIDRYGRIYVSQFSLIQQFDSDGNYLGRIGVSGWPFGIFITDQDELFVASNKQKLFKYMIKPPAGD